MISAQIIADSLAPNGSRLTTFILKFPRIVLAEFNTHRMISKNSASSRAIPFKKMLEMVKETPFVPIAWMKEHKGMQGTEYFDEVESENRTKLWLEARDKAAEMAYVLSAMGVTKQMCNRLLEPFMYHTVIATASDWENFFALRAHDQAEIHIQALAYEMLHAYNNSEPRELRPSQWHIPFGDSFQFDKLIKLEPKNAHELDLIKVKIATARCARVSYLNFEGKDDYEADLKLHETLASSGHWSPFEHCAQAHAGDYRSGNFNGFTQYRKFFSQENKSDLRAVKYRR